MTGTAIQRKKRAYSLDELESETSMSKAFYRKEIRARRLRAKLVGSRVLVLAEDLDQYLDASPDWTEKLNRDK